MKLWHSDVNFEFKSTSRISISLHTFSAKPSRNSVQWTGIRERARLIIMILIVHMGKTCKLWKFLYVFHLSEGCTEKYLQLLSNFINRSTLCCSGNKTIHNIFLKSSVHQPFTCSPSLEIMKYQFWRHVVSGFWFVLNAASPMSLTDRCMYKIMQILGHHFSIKLGIWLQVFEVSLIKFHQL